MAFVLMALVTIDATDLSDAVVPGASPSSPLAATPDTTAPGGSGAAALGASVTASATTATASGATGALAALDASGAPFGSDAPPLNPSLPANSIADGATPLAKAPSFGNWALLNLICAAASLLWAAVLLSGLLFAKHNRANNDGSGHASSGGFARTDKGRRFGGQLVAIAIGGISLAVFFLTENLTLPVGWVDSWSPLMVVLLLVQDVITLQAVTRRSAEAAVSRTA
jgi:hypothetical protein